MSDRQPVFLNELEGGMSEKPVLREGFEYYQRLSEKQSGLLQTLIDVSRVITTSHDLEETLAQTVRLIADRMQVDVCSIYLLEDETSELVLKATHGLSASAVGKVRLPVSEGLIGLVSEQRTPVNVRDVATHPRFKYFPEIEEESLSSFLGIPLVEYRKALGVLAIQNKESRLFSSEEENLLLTIASQISGLISKAVMVERVQQAAGAPIPGRSPGESIRLDGIPIAPGLAMEEVTILKRHRIEEPSYQPSGTIEDEHRKLLTAVEASVQEILALIQEVTLRLGEQDAAIFHAHLLFLEDRNLLQRIMAHIEQGSSAAWAVAKVIKEHLKAFQSIDDPYLRERGADLEDVGMRLLQHLDGASARRVQMDKAGVLVAEMLTPSDTAQLDPSKVKGIITSYGGHVSHAAILARSLRIPAVSGIPNLLDQLVEGEPVLVDGTTGAVFANPEESILREYDRHLESQRAYLERLDDLREVPCTTKDGHRIFLYGNVGLSQDLDDFSRYGAEGIGLYRTEVFYLMQNDRPSFDELVETYANTLAMANGKPVIFRTLDLGGDKFPHYMHFPKEENPFLGLRSIRYQLRWQSLLSEQLKAILTVADKGPLKIMFPMISHLDELHEVKRIYLDCRAEMEKERGASLPEVELGMMFEVPSAVLMCELFIGEIDFLSIGSNDLTQYILAVDRNNPNVSHLYDPLDPAVLMMIQRLIQVANQHNKPIELCGEMASDPEGCLILAGLGLREMSMNPPLIPLVKDRLAQYTMSQLEELAGIALTSTTGQNVRRNIELYLHN